jgi:putative hydrolase of the HAD superfamily
MCVGRKALSKVRAIFFDAVGTLLFPEPPAATVYGEVGRLFGSRLSIPVIRERFAAAFAREEEIDRGCGWQTSEERERRRWERIVASVLDDVADPAGCFRELYEHFGRADAWTLNHDTHEVLGTLAARGYELGMASNYDHRLRRVLAGLPKLRCLRLLAISSELGWRKPAVQFFAEVCRLAKFPAEEVLYVGDDRVSDYEGARAAGLQAVLFDPGNKDGSGIARIGRLTDLLSTSFV